MHFCHIFLFFISSISWKCVFYLGKITILKIFAKSMLLQFSCIFPLKNRLKTFPKWGPSAHKIDAKNVLFSDIHFLTFLLRFWRVLGLQVGAKLAILGPQDPPQSLQNPVFWEHVPKMLPKKPQSGSKSVPRKAQKSIFGGFSTDLGGFFRYFWLWKFILSTKNPGIICTCWVTPSLEKYILTDFKPHVQGRPAVCA